MSGFCGRAIRSAFLLNGGVASTGNRTQGQAIRSDWVKHHYGDFAISGENLVLFVGAVDCHQFVP